MSKSCANDRRNNIQWIPITKFVPLPCVDTDCVASGVGYPTSAVGSGDGNHDGHSANSCCAYTPGTAFGTRDNCCEDPREASPSNPAITDDTYLVMASSIHRSARRRRRATAAALGESEQ